MTNGNVQRVLITGVTGFIGHHLAVHYLEKGHQVTGIDIKFGEDSFSGLRLIQLKKYQNFSLSSIDLRIKSALEKFMSEASFDLIIHLAARTGVLASSAEYEDYISTNILASAHLFDLASSAHIPVIYASSSSVYGESDLEYFSETDPIGKPASIYATTKMSCENLAYHYALKNESPIYGLRFFTVYGPYNRQDMAIYKFMNAIMNGKEIVLYNKGEMYRDFTYVSDIVQGIHLVGELMLENETKEVAEIYNIGFGETHRVSEVIEHLEEFLGQRAQINFKDRYSEDVIRTQACTKKLYDAVKFKPEVGLKEGLQYTCNWFIKHHSTAKV